MLDLSGKEKMVQYFKDQIKNGYFQPGFKIKSTKDLSIEFNIAVNTAQSALKKLEDAGYLERKRGCGTFICQSSSNEKTREASGTILLVTHIFKYYQNYLSELSLCLQAKGYTVKVIEYRMDDKAFLREYEKNRSDIAILSDVHVADLLSKHRLNEHLICLADVHEYRFAGDIISFNYYDAAYQATQHLYSLGYRKIACYTMDFHYGKRQRMTAKSAEFGYLDALEERNISDPLTFRFYVGEQDSTPIYEMFSNGKPEAVVCMFDYRTLQVKEIAEELGMRIPEDLALISLGESDIAKENQLSCINFCENNIIPICQNLIEDILTRRKPLKSRQCHLLENELHIRQSCGYKLKHKSNLNSSWQKQLKREKQLQQAKYEENVYVN